MSRYLHGVDVLGARPSTHVVGVEVPPNRSWWKTALWGAAVVGAGWLAFGGKSAYVTPPRARMKTR